MAESETFKIEIPLSVVDGTSGGIQSAQYKVTAFEATVTKLQASLKQMNGSASITAQDKASGTISKVQNGLGQLTKTAWTVSIGILDRATAPLRSLMSSLGQLITSPLGLLGIGVGGAGAIGGLIMGPLAQAATLQTMTNSLRFLMGSQVLANQRIAQLQQYSLGTQFTVAQLFGANNQLLGAGFTGGAVQTELNTAASIATVTGGGPQSLDNITRDLAQMHSGIYLTLGEIESLQANGYNALQVLATGFHMSQQQMKAWIEGGMMPASKALDMFNQDVAKRFPDALAVGANSLTGLVTSLHDIFTINFAQSWGTGLSDAVQPKLKALVDWFGANKATVDRWKVSIHDAAAEVGNFAMNGVGGLVTAFSDLTNNPAFQAMNLGDKIKLAWKTIIADPFDKWWASDGHTWAMSAADTIGRALGSSAGGIADVLLGINGTDTGNSVGGAFAKGFIAEFAAEVSISKLLIASLGPPGSIDNQIAAFFNVSGARPSTVPFSNYAVPPVGSPMPVFGGGSNPAGVVPDGTVSTTKGAMIRAGGIPNQFDYAKSGELSAADAASACGPTAALAFARANGRNPTIQEAMALAKKYGWTQANGMPGPASEAALAKAMAGVETTMTAGSGSSAADQAIAAGQTAIISTADHYLEADAYDPKTGKYHVGGTGQAFRGGSDWMTWAQISQLGGGVNGTITGSGSAAAGSGNSTKGPMDPAGSASKQALMAMAYADAQKYGLDPATFLAQIDQESQWDPNATSSAGARGLGQLMPSSYPGVNALDPAANLDAAAQTDQANMARYHGNTSLALAAYNAGAGNVDKYGQQILDPTAMSANGWGTDSAGQPAAYVAAIQSKKGGYQVMINAGAIQVVSNIPGADHPAVKQFIAQTTNAYAASLAKGLDQAHANAAN